MFSDLRYPSLRNKQLLIYKKRVTLTVCLLERANRPNIKEIDESGIVTFLRVINL